MPPDSRRRERVEAALSLRQFPSAYPDWQFCEEHRVWFCYQCVICSECLFYCSGL